MPLSKQRNKHIQHVLVEAAKLLQGIPTSWRWFARENYTKRNPNRATLAVARKMVSYMLAVERRKQNFVPAENFTCTTAA